VLDARTTLTTLTCALGLTPSTPSDLRTFQALVVSALVVLEDAFSWKLKGYGAVDPQLPAVLDPLLERLHAQLVAIGRALPSP
jgi:hypothetical protein